MNCSQNTQRKIINIFWNHYALVKGVCEGIKLVSPAACPSLAGIARVRNLRRSYSNYLFTLWLCNGLFASQKHKPGHFSTMVFPSTISPQPSSGETKESYWPRVGSNKWLLNEWVSERVNRWIDGFINVLMNTFYIPWLFLFLPSLDYFCVLIFKCVY